MDAVCIVPRCTGIASLRREGEGLMAHAAAAAAGDDGDQ